MTCMKKCSSGPSLSKIKQPDINGSGKGLFNDPLLIPFEPVISGRQDHALAYEKKLVQTFGRSLMDVSDYHEDFGLHRDSDGWVFREWAPHARDMHLVCPASGWEKQERFRVPKKDDQIFEARFEKNMLHHGDLFRLKVSWPGGEGDRIPTAVRRVVQDPETLIFNAQVWEPEHPYEWKIPHFTPSKHPLLIYETHVGMALEDGRVGTFAEFERYILPKIVTSGYNTLQIMALLEHPYYGSIGYHVAGFFAPSSRFGTPEELKSLIDTAHGAGLSVFIDMVQSHAVANEVEGLSRFDGTAFQFFHDGPKGHHRQWDSKCFDYGKPEVARFLLSCLRYWIEEFHVDGFRFDGVTSMLFEDHGLGISFNNYAAYYGDDVDKDALSYLRCANHLVHDLKSSFVTIAEDVSGYPGLAAPIKEGGVGFDFRYAMGIADYWIKLLKEVRDEDWHLGSLWYELTCRRKEEKTISYAESHDQALVGDQTLIMRLMGDRIYTDMRTCDQSVYAFRAASLHKMIRLITLACAGSGYLNFMGNEFGHPEWIDFPSERNQFSFHYARRQWSLAYDKDLVYSCLWAFDQGMVSLIREREGFFDCTPRLIHIHETNRIIAFERHDLVFVFNFHAERSFSDYRFEAPRPGKYKMVFNSDETEFFGQGRLKTGQVHFTLFEKKPRIHNDLSLYLPARTAVVLENTEAK